MLRGGCFLGFLGLLVILVVLVVLVVLDYIDFLVILVFLDSMGTFLLVHQIPLRASHCLFLSLCPLWSWR